MKNFALNHIQKTLSKDAFWIVNKHIAKLVGINASLLLSDLISKHEYFSKENETEWFFNTSENIEENTTLSYHKQKQALSQLEKYQMIETKLMGVPAKLFFKINYSVIDFILKTKIEDLLKLDLEFFKNWNSKNSKSFNKNKDNNIYTSRARAMDDSKTENEKIGFAKALDLYGYCQKLTPARDLWDSLPAFEQQKIMEHIPLYVKNHEENGKRNYLPDFFRYLSEERYNAPALPYQKAEPNPGEVDKSDWKMWPDGILRPPDVKRNPEGIYYHEGNNQPYVIIPKNPYK